MLDDPARYAGAAILYGTLPFDAGLPTDAGRLANLPVFVAQGDADHVIPRELLDRTWDYLLGESGAPPSRTATPAGTASPRPTTVRRCATGSPTGSRFVDHRGATPAGPRADVAVADAADGRLPGRARPAARGLLDIPQQQQSQNAPADLQERLLRPASATLPGVERRPVTHLRARRAGLHPRRDGAERRPTPSSCRRSGSSRTCTRPTTAPCTSSCPPTLPPTSSPGLGPTRTRGPAPASPPASCMVYGPRDEDELATVRSIVAASHAYATGII